MKLVTVVFAPRFELVNGVGVTMLSLLVGPDEGADTPTSQFEPVTHEPFAAPFQE